MTAIANGPVAAAANRPSKFQLPALDLKFGSLTEGTDIPPPLPSPIQEEPPEQPKTAQVPVDGSAKSTGTSIDTATTATSTTTTTTTTNGTQTTPEAQRIGTKRPADTAGPASPTSSTGPASIRRLFSRYRLNDKYHANMYPPPVEALAPRPSSQSNASIATDRTKRSSGWFRRLRGSDGLETKRSSRIFFTDNSKPAAPIVVQRTGPPPPKIPEFNALGAKVDLDDGGSLGSDLFKDIK